MATEGIVQEQNDQGQWIDIAPDTPMFERAKPAPTSDQGDDAEEGVETPPPAAAKPAEGTADKPAADSKKGKPRHDPEARISQAVARQREAERRAEEAERRLRERESAPPKPAAEKPAAQAKPERFPDYASYVGENPDATLEDWMEARDTWRDERRDAQMRAQAETERTETTFKSRVETFGERFSQAAKTDPDLIERVDKRLLGVRPLSALTAADKQIINSIQDPIERNEVVFRCFLADQWIDSEHAVELLEKLSDPAEFQRLAALPPNRVVWELARSVDGKSAANPAASAKASEPITSKAPAPIAPLRSTPHQAEDAEPGDDASDDDWLRWERARMAKAARR